jgi:hypothetical protein
LIKKREVKLLPLMEDFLIELRYFLLKKGGEAPFSHGGLPHWTQVLADKMNQGQVVVNEDGVYSDLISEARDRNTCPQADIR